MHKLVTLTKKSALLDYLLFAIAIGLFSLSGFVEIPLMFSPVPLVIQVNVAILYGAIFGAKRSLAILLSSYCLGAVGMPMFAGGAFGIAHLIGPTGGYLVGYLLAAFIMGRLVESKRPTSSMQLFHYFNLANAAVYLCGLPVLSQFIGWKMAFFAGLLPFLPGMILKNIFMAKLLSKSTNYSLLKG